MAEQIVDQNSFTGSGTLVQRIRLYSGLILMAYATSHFANHAFGLHSLELMQLVSDYHNLIWQSTVGNFALYLALFVHISLGLWKFANLKTWRLPAWEWGQMILGLCIPFWLASHLTYTKFAERELGIEVDYNQEIALIWSGAIFQQNALLLIVWFHGCIGLHFWLRLKPWYNKYQAYLASLMCLIPALSLAGWMTAARWQADLNAAANEVLSGSGSEATAQITPEQQEANDLMQFVLQALGEWEHWFKSIVVGVGIAVCIWMLVRSIFALTKEHITVEYGDGNEVKALPGTSLLDISRANGISHMSVCGGRARCSTCRTLILEGRENLTPVTPAEKTLLDRLNADPGIRLACQAQVSGNVSIRPLIQTRASASSPSNTDPLGWGVEKQIAVMFLDIRGFSAISEKSLPYDVVFILNSFFGEVTSEIEASGGFVDKFMGDGLMALFGISSSPEEACRDALRAASAAHQAASRVSAMLTQHLDQPIKVGIGVHAGNVVLGRIGKTNDQTAPSRLTAVGDTVNVAARLESATKEYDKGIVVSRSALKKSGLIEDRNNLKLKSILEDVIFEEIQVHNIDAAISIAAISSDGLKDLIEAQKQST